MPRTINTAKAASNQAALHQSRQPNENNTLRPRAKSRATSKLLRTEYPLVLLGARVKAAQYAVDSVTSKGVETSFDFEGWEQVPKAVTAEYRG